MTALSQVRMLTRYKAWANAVIFAAVRGLPDGEATRLRPTRFGSIVHTLNHVYVIDRVFQAHLLGISHGYAARNTPTSPPLSELHECVQAVDQWYVEYAHQLTDLALDRRISFEFIGGGTGVMSCHEMMLHVVNHGTYHRGFVSDLMYQAGATPEATDLPVFLRDVEAAELKPFAQ